MQTPDGCFQERDISFGNGFQIRQANPVPAFDTFENIVEVHVGEFIHSKTQIVACIVGVVEVKLCSVFPDFAVDALPLLTFVEIQRTTSKRDPVFGRQPFRPLARRQRPLFKSNVSTKDLSFFIPTAVHFNVDL